MSAPSTISSPVAPVAPAEAPVPVGAVADWLAPRLLGTRSRRIALGVGVVAIVGFWVLSLFIDLDYWMTVLDYTLIAAIAALALNVLSGYAGQVSLGIAFFMAVGAYTAAYLGGTPDTSSCRPNACPGLGLPFVIWLPAAGVAAALLGALVGPAALRLKGFYLGIVSLGLIFIGYHLFANIPAIVAYTGGAAGRSFPPLTIGGFSLSDPPQDLPFGFVLTRNELYFLVLVPILAAAALFVGNVMRSRAGRAMQGMRDNETAASIMGVNLFQAKMGAFVFSSFLAGIAGALYASFATVMQPVDFSLNLSIAFVAAIIIGGVATVWGSILGAAFVFALPYVIDALPFLPQASSTSHTLTGQDLSPIIYGLVTIVFLLFQPGGLIGLVRRGGFRPRFQIRRREGGEPATTTASTP